MKKIIILMGLLLMVAASSELFAQSSIPLRLVNGSGDPLTGQSANIVFTKYPHNYPTDAVAGLTITEVGTAGNYACKGFTTYQYVKLWLSGVNQTWFDSVQTGSITTYINTLLGSYVTLATTQTITGQKTASGDWFLSNDWIQSAGDFQVYKPYIIGTSPWLSDFTLMGATSLVWKGYLTSNYVDTSKIYYDGTKLRLKTGYKLYGVTNTVPPILINTDQFTWNETDGLSLNTGFGSDSVSSENFTVKKDTTWQVLGEDVTKFRSMSLKKPWWGQMLTNFNAPDWKWYYKSFNESGTVVASDSFAVINDYVTHTKSSVPTLDSSYQEINSKTITYGVWSISFSTQYDFTDVSLGGGGGGDTIKCILVVSNMGDYDTLATCYTTENYIVGANVGRAGVLSWNVVYDGTGMIPGETRTLYLKAREWAAGSGVDHRITLSTLSCVLIR